MQTINLYDYDIFCNNKSTLKETSKDSSNSEYMTISEIAAINFDLVKDKYIEEIDLPSREDGYACSIDAIIYSEDSIVFVEFKNGDMKNQKKSVRDKIRDSLLIFGAITNKNISFTRTNIDFILVYNGEKNPLPNQVQKRNAHETSSITYLAKSIAARAKDELILFGLEKFKKLYFRQIHTFTQEEFEKYLQKHCCNDSD